MIKLMICLIYGFPFGLLLGSYAACMGYRLPRKISIWGRSKCDNCGNNLGVTDLIPVLGYVLRSGHCKYCGKKLSPSYTFIELFSGVVATLLMWVWGPTAIYVKYMVLTTGLLIAFVSDQQTYLIPDKLTLSLAVLAIPLTLWAGDITLKTSLIGGVIGLTIYLLPWVFTRQLPGGGDIKLLGVIGLYLGPSVLMLTIIGASVVIIASHGVSDLKKKIPLAPYLAMGCIVTMLFF